MSTFKTGKCPGCSKNVASVELDTVEITMDGQNKFRGVTYQCQNCHTVLGVQMDPLGIAGDIVRDIARGLKDRG